MTDERLPEEIERAVGLVDDTAAEWGIFKGPLKPRIEAVEALRRAILAGMLERHANVLDDLLSAPCFEKEFVMADRDMLCARAKAIREGR